MFYDKHPLVPIETAINHNIYMKQIHFICMRTDSTFGNLVLARPLSSIFLPSPDVGEKAVSEVRRGCLQ